MATKHGKISKLNLFLVLAGTLLVFLAAIFVTLGQIGKRQLIGSKAQSNCIVVPSMDSISSTAKSLSANSTFCVQVPGSLYRTAMVTAARAYIQQTGNTTIGEPIDTNLVSYNNIRGTFSYGPPYERKYVEFYYYYYVDTTYGRVQARVTSGTIGGRVMSTAERGTIEAEANKMAVYLWGVYSHLVVPTNIYNDANYVYVTFKVLSTLTPITPTPLAQCNTPCNGNTGCPVNLFCYFDPPNAFTGYCRKSSCPAVTNCLCATPTPTPIPIPTATPTKTPRPTPTLTPTAILTPTGSPSGKVGDVNGDGKVNIVDIGVLIDNYGSSPPTDPKADLNKDGIVNIIDIGILIDNYGK